MKDIKVEEQINKTGNRKSTTPKIWSLRISIINMAIARITKKEKIIHKSPLSEMKEGDITLDPTGIKGIIKNYDEQVHDHKFDNLDKMSQFFWKTNFSKHT